MLNPFPELLSYSLLAPFFLRIILGIIFLNLGYLKLNSENGRWRIFFEGIGFKPATFFLKFFAFVEMIAGGLILIGLFTQFAALVLAILTFGELYIEFKEESLLKRNFVFYLLIFTISLSLIFSGAGFFAFDFPL